MCTSTHIYKQSLVIHPKMKKSLAQLKWVKYRNNIHILHSTQQNCIQTYTSGLQIKHIGSSDDVLHFYELNIITHSQTFHGMSLTK